MKDIRLARRLATAALITCLILLVQSLSAQTAGQSVIQKKNTGAGFTLESFTLSNGQLIGRTSAGTLSGITLGSGLTLTGTTLTASGSSGGTWGSITGTLSSQTDLQTALNLCAPLASPTFTGTVTIPSGASISGYLTTAAAASTYQPLDSDLTALAALTTTAHGRSLLTGANPAATLITLGLSPDDDLAINNIIAGGTVSAALFSGDGGGLSNLSGGSITAASIPNTALANSSLTIDGTVRSLGDSFSVLPSGITLTGGAVSAVTITRTALGTTPTTGLTLTNTTPAAAGAQQVSPRAIFTGNGWKTTATAASQPVSFGFSVLPVQGSTAPTGAFLIESDINNAGTWPDVLSVTTDGVVSLPNGAGGTMTQFGSVSGGIIRVAPGGQTAQVGTASSAVFSGYIYPAASSSAGSIHSDGTGNVCLRGYYDPTLAQEFSIYKVDSGSNDELAKIGWRSTTNSLVIETVRTGTGSARSIILRVNGTDAITISPTGAISLTLPTTAGATGTLWNDAGTVKVAP